MPSIRIVSIKETPAIAIREKVKVTEIPSVMGRIYGELFPHLGNDVKRIGHRSHSTTVGRVR